MIRIIKFRPYCLFLCFIKNSQFSPNFTNMKTLSKVLILIILLSRPFVSIIAQTQTQTQIQNPTQAPTPTPTPTQTQTQTPTPIQSPKLYSHKITIDSVLQTSKYTYVKATEKIKSKDSLIWMALPTIQPKIGGTYYYESGLAMGTFQSKELNRTFKQILFLGCLGTTPEMLPNNVIPPPVVETAQAVVTPVKEHPFTVKEILPAGSYMYLHVDEAGKDEWIAVVKIPVAVGQKYSYADAAPMKQFFSKELNRTFPEVLFVSKLKVL